MLARIRHITHKRRGTVVQSERILDRQTLSIGRATDQDIFLSDLGVSYNHARLTLSANGTIGVSSLSKVGLYLSGRFVQSGTLQKMGEIIIGPYKIKINAGIKISHVKGTIEVDITYEKIAEDVVQVQAENLPAMRLEQTWLNKRVASWASFVAVLVVFIVVPAIGLISDGGQAVLRDSILLPGDGIWNTGEVAAAHRHFRGKCETCHQKVFHSIEDSACTECHYDLLSHASDKSFDMLKLDEATCAGCHEEHNGAGGLIRKDSSLCTDCHEDLSKHIETKLENVENFELSHPEFSPMLYLGDTLNNIENSSEERISLSEIDIKHKNGLKFSHAQHLNINGLRTPEGKRILDCVDCHQKNDTGKILLPVKMELHCRECHQLKFDKKSPDKILAHSDVESLAVSLKEYYALQALKTGNAGLFWAKQKTANTLLFAKSRNACGMCHKIDIHADTSISWDIHKVNLSQRAFSRANFDHYAHRATACQNCHEAEKSSVSSDVLYPGINVCKECHGDENADDKISSSCTMCHSYHSSIAGH